MDNRIKFLERGKKIRHEVCADQKYPMSEILGQVSSQTQARSSTKFINDGTNKIWIAHSM